MPTATDFVPTVLCRLTPAEQVVSKLIVEGASNPEIAGYLGISRHTVESHLKHIFVKLGIGSRVQLAVLLTRRAGQ